MTTFHDFLRTGADRHGDRTAIAFDDQELTYAEVLAGAEGLAHGLCYSGITAQDRLAIIMDNSIECVLSWLAGNLVGCTDIPINPQYRGELLHYLLHDSAASAIVCDTRYLAQVLEVSERLPSLHTIIVNGNKPRARAGNCRIVTLDACMTGSAFSPVEDSDEQVILYTSGTTGPSKGVIHTQESCLVLSRYNAAVLGYDADDRLLNFFPLFHQNARYTGVVPALCAGASIRVERRLSTSTFWDTCDRDGITAFNYLGSVLRMILNVTQPDRRAGTHTVRKAFGAGATAGVWREFEERLGVELYETYGLSEAPMATLNLPGKRRAPLGSAGYASDLFEVAVFDENDQPLPAGEIGEIVLRPKRANALMAGYHNKVRDTVSAFRNLWFHSGDRGFLGNDGELYFEERKKDSIRRRGENISAWEVESVVEQHPGVKEAAVYGVASQDQDEEVAVSFIPSVEPVDFAALLAFLADRLPKYAVPTLLRAVPDLPRTPTAKVKKDELRAIAREEYAALSPAPVRPETASGTG